MKDIIVLAGSTPWSVLSLCKCAFKHKAKAYVVCVKNGWGSKYAKCRYVHKAYDIQETELDTFWERFFTENTITDFPILYVTSDYVCQIVERNRTFYDEHFDLCMASSYIVKSFIDKNLATIEASKHGLTIPKTQELHSEADVDKVCSSFTFPVIVKPVTFMDHSKAGFKTQICYTKQQLKEFVPQHLADEINLQCQEYIEGEDKDCVFYQFYRDQDGNITECMGEKTLQTTGIMTIGTTKYDTHLSKMCRDFLQDIDYIGIGGIEFKRYNGKFYFIEMSTRTEGFLPISDMAQVSLSEISYLSLNKCLSDIPKQRDEVEYVVMKPWILDSLNKHRYIRWFCNFIKRVLSSDSYFVDFYLDWKWCCKHFRDY